MYHDLSAIDLSDVHGINFDADASIWQIFFWAYFF